MIARLVKFLRGNVRVSIKGVYLERFLNICAANFIEFSDFNRTDIDEMYMTVTFPHYKKLKQLGEKTHCEVKIVKKNGIPFLAIRFRKRYGLIAGAVLLAVAIYYASNYIWYINIDAPPGISQREVSSKLAELGVYPGAYAKDIKAKDIQLKMMLEMDNVAFFAINVSGNKADVQIIKSKETPLMEQEELITNIVSDKTGVITKMDVKGGTGLKKVGDTVVKGERLVDALVNPINEEHQSFLAHSMADVEARTWYHFNRVYMLCGNEKEYNGDTKTKYYIVWNKKRINLLADSGIETGCCDKIEEKIQFNIFGEVLTPFYIVKQTYRYYDVIPYKIDGVYAQEVIKKGAKEQLLKDIRGTITTFDGVYSEDENTAKLFCTAECLESIGQQVIDYREEIKKEVEEEPND